MIAEWLLDLVIDGSTYRYSVLGATVTRLDSSVVEYRSGLADLGGVERGIDEISITISDSAVDWPTLASRIRRATLRRWDGAQVLESCDVYVMGEVRDVAHGTRHEPCSLRVVVPPTQASRGVALPDALSRVSDDTWNSTRGGAGSVVVDIGQPFPLVFGLPGQDETVGGEPVVPVPVLSHSSSRIYVMVSDGHVDASSVMISDDTRGGALSSQTLTKNFDALRRPVSYANIASSAAAYMANATDPHRYLVAFTSGSGLAATAWEVIEYMLGRWGTESADWSRLSRAADDLSVYRVDTWIDQRIADPWVWIEALLEHLPFEIIWGGQGAYLRRVRWQPLGQTVGAWLVGRDAVRMSSRRFVAGAANEFVARYRLGAEADEWRGRVITTAAGGPRGLPPQVIGWGREQVIEDGRCTASLSRWGFAQSASVDLDWTWDEATAQAVLDWRVERDAVDAWETTYALLDGQQLELGDEVQIEDPELGLESVAAVVIAPPTADRTDYVTVQLRYPA